VLPLLLLLCLFCAVWRMQAYEGLRTADRLDEQYVFIPQKVKDVYLHHLLLHCLASLQQQQQAGAAPPAAAAEQGSGSEGFKRVRSAIIFVSTCKGCHMLSLVLRELGLPAAALHSGEPQRLMCCIYVGSICLRQQLHSIQQHCWCS
jgi:ATP-dependent RNA helicase DDX49/DBP8